MKSGNRKWPLFLDRGTRITLTVFLSTITFGSAQEWRAVEVKTSKIADSIYFMEGILGFGGGNVTVSIGGDGVLLVDNMYDWMMPKLKKAVAEITDKKIEIAINSHFHGDHIQGNKNLKEGGTLVIGHKNLFKRLAAYSSTKPQILDLLPTITFSEHLEIHFNGETVEMIHYPNCHTDNDIIIFFKESKVLHLGDIFFQGMFPAVYTSSGGNIKQLILSLEDILTRFPKDCKVVPGHGRVSTMQELGEYLDMLKKSVQIVENGIKSGKSLEEMVADKVLMEYDDLGNGGAQTTEEYLAMLYGLLKQ
ncbi:MBL fold metallo-hydrolase [Flavobacteriaceae bacterium GF1]